MPGKIRAKKLYLAAALWQPGAARPACTASEPAGGMIWARAMSISFIVTSLIVIVSPGTGVLYTLAAALTRGSRASIAAAFGCTLGIVPHMSAAMLGLAAVLHTSALAFAALKWCGVIYLLYMAWQALRERGALAIEPRLDACPRPHRDPAEGDDLAAPRLRRRLRRAQ